jgi:NADH-quinone oxidoreductase subunit L
MLIPLIVLSIPSIFAGFLEGWFTDFLKRAVPNHLHEVPHSVELMLVVITVSLALFGLFVAALLYYWRKISPEAITQNPLVRPVYALVFNKYYFDEIYYYLFVRGVGFGLGKVSAFIDKFVIDGIVNGLAFITKGVGEVLRYSQTGLVNAYALYFAFGLALVIAILWLI